MFYVYILASQRNGTLYIGQTSDLWRRVLEHKRHQLGGFSAKHNVTMLVYFEGYETREEARLREKQMKAWKRRWKIAWIERENPEWRDLYEARAL